MRAAEQSASATVPGDMGTPESRYHGDALTDAPVALMGRDRRRRLGGGRPAGTPSAGWGARAPRQLRFEQAKGRNLSRTFLIERLGYSQVVDGISFTVHPLLDGIWLADPPWPSSCALQATARRSAAASQLTAA